MAVLTKEYDKDGKLKYVFDYKKEKAESLAIRSEEHIRGSGYEAWDFRFGKI
jgi:hypothetical protein